MSEVKVQEQKNGKTTINGRDKQKSHVHVYPVWCKGCGICVAFCPKQVLEMGADQKAHVVHPERCIRCGLCARRCPDFAITVIEEDAGASDEDGD